MPIHLAFPRTWIIHELKRKAEAGDYTTRGFLKPEISIGAAIQAMESDKRDYITFCNNYDSKGRCKGCPNEN